CTCRRATATLTPSARTGRAWKNVSRCRLTGIAGCWRSKPRTFDAPAGQRPAEARRHNSRGPKVPCCPESVLIFRRLENSRRQVETVLLALVGGLRAETGWFQTSTAFV